MLEYDEYRLELQGLEKEITDLNIVKDYFITDNKFVKLYGDFDKYYTDEYKKRMKPSSDSLFGHIVMIDDKTYKELKNKYKITNDNPIYINYETSQGNIFKTESVIDFKMCDLNCDTYTFNLINEIPNELKKFNLNNVIIVNEEIFNSIIDKSFGVEVSLLSNDYIKLDKKVKDFLKNPKYQYYYFNSGLENIQTINDIKCINICVK